MNIQLRRSAQDNGRALMQSHLIQRKSLNVRTPCERGHLPLIAEAMAGDGASREPDWRLVILPGPNLGVSRLIVYSQVTRIGRTLPYDRAHPSKTTQPKLSRMGIGSGGIAVDEPHWAADPE
jgi:hypothetical protein